ncbi:MAG: hypothetical protein KDA87_08570, partial [Planctomycetales bacterium]|nr:hypothetical protein [Planctomycetales bacterium]
MIEAIFKDGFWKGFDVFVWVEARVTAMFVRIMVFVLSLSGTLSADMMISDFEAVVNDRFADRSTSTHPDRNLFFDPGFDYSGVARAASSNWVTMISPTTFLSSNHSHPVNGTLVTFHHGNGPSNLNTSVRTVASGMQLGNTDLWIGELSSAVDPNVTYYGIATSLTIGDTVWQMGISPSANYGATPTTDMAMGRNVVDASGNVMLGTSVTFSSGYIDDTVAGDLVAPFVDPGPHLLTYETYFQEGDSGGPSFIANGAQLLLVGIHSFIGSVDVEAPFDGTPERRVSGDVFLPHYRTQILANTT